jgi:hypothetical protein
MKIMKNAAVYATYIPEVKSLTEGAGGIYPKKSNIIKIQIFFSSRE